MNTTVVSIGATKTRLECVICHGASRRLFQKHGYWIRACELCGHRFAEVTPSRDHVAAVYGDDYFLNGGAGYRDYLGEAESLRMHGLEYARLLDKRMARGRVLDVGAAAGLVLRGLCDAGWTGRGLEPNERMAAHGRTLGLRMDVGTLESYRSDERFDLVSMIQVVAHFADPHAALAVAADLTEPSGYWLIETWDRASWTARAFGRHWHEYSPPSVLHWYSPEGLAQLVAEHGFIEVARGRPRKRLSAAHAKSLLRYKAGGSTSARVALAPLDLLPDPLMLRYPAEDLFWALYRR